VAKGPDWPDQLLSGSYPAGIFDQSLARDCVNVETAYDDTAFTVDSILGWWEIDGQRIFPEANKLVILTEIPSPAALATYQRELQRLANETGLNVSLIRFPPGTSKWNRPAYRLFSFTSSEWAEGPVRDLETVARLIGFKDEVRTMAKGLRLDHSRYPQPQEVGGKGAPLAFEAFWDFTFKPEFFPSEDYAESLEADEGLARAI
jgi:hypothetical protein